MSGKSSWRFSKKGVFVQTLFKANRYTIVAQGEPQKHNSQQKSLFQALKEEFNFFLMKKNLITKRIDKPGQEEVLRDELKKILEKKCYKIDSWKADETILNGKKVYIRPGSPNPNESEECQKLGSGKICSKALYKAEYETS